MISEKFGENGVQLERNRHDNSCKIFSKSGIVNLKNFAPLLGFPANAVVRANAWKKSPPNVDVNLGLRYVTVDRNCVDTDKNFDSAGKRSKVIATVPVTSEQSLNSTVTFYEDIYSEVSVVNGDHENFEFNVDTNIGKDVNLTLIDRFRSRTSTSRRREWRDLARKYGVVFASGVVTVIFRTPKTIFHVVSRTSSCCFNFFFQKGT